MLFNRDNNGAAELRKLTGSYYATNDFTKIENFVKMAEEEMIELTGQALYDQLDSIYNPSGSGSAGGGLEGNDQELLDVYRTPIAYKAAFNFYKANLVTHQDTGRKVKLDNNNEKMPWEWMLEADNKAQLGMIRSTTDRLIKYLDKNEIDTWLDSPKRKAIRKLFVNSHELFNDVYPINNSPSFFYTILPFISEVQRKHIKPALGAIYSEQLAAWQLYNPELEAAEGSGSAGGGLPEAIDLELIAKIQQCVPLLAMVIAVKRLSLQVLPEGVVQQFSSMVQTTKASQPSMDAVREAWITSMMKDANQDLNELKRYVTAPTEEPTYIPEQSTDIKGLRT